MSASGTSLYSIEGLDRLKVKKKPQPTLFNKENKDSFIFRLLIYPPKANRVNEMSKRFIVSGEDVLHRAAMGSEFLHSCWCHLVFSLTGQH